MAKKKCNLIFKGKKYTEDQFLELLRSGELQNLIDKGDIDATKLEGIEGKKETWEMTKKEFDEYWVDTTKKTSCRRSKNKF